MVMDQDDSTNAVKHSVTSQKDLIIQQHCCVNLKHRDEEYYTSTCSGNTTFTPDIILINACL